MIYEDRTTEEKDRKKIESEDGSEELPTRVTRSNILVSADGASTTTNRGWHWVGITVLCPAISVKESTEKLKDFL